MKQGKVTIRRAVKKDAPVLAALSSQLGYPSSVSQIEKRLNKILKHQDHLVLVSIVSQKVTGWIHVFLNLRVESDSFSEIGGLVVDEKHRSKGIGKLLCKEAEKWTKGMKMPKLRVRSNVIRKETHAFYLRFGYKPEKEQKVFGKKL